MLWSVFHAPLLCWFQHAHMLVIRSFRPDLIDGIRPGSMPAFHVRPRRRKRRAAFAHLSTSTAIGYDQCQTTRLCARSNFPMHPADWQMHASCLRRTQIVSYPSAVSYTLAKDRPHELFRRLCTLSG